jgi:hypothetical protein
MPITLLPPPLPLQIKSINAKPIQLARKYGMPYTVWTLRNEPRYLVENYQGEGCCCMPAMHLSCLARCMGGLLRSLSLAAGSRQLSVYR